MYIVGFDWGTGFCISTHPFSFSFSMYGHHFEHFLLASNACKGQATLSHFSILLSWTAYLLPILALVYQLAIFHVVYCLEHLPIAQVVLQVFDGRLLVCICCYSICINYMNIYSMDIFSWTDDSILFCAWAWNPGGAWAWACCFWPPSWFSPHPKFGWLLQIGL